MIRMLKHVVLATALAVSTPMSRGADETLPTAIDIASLNSADNLRLSPDGDLLAYTLTTRKLKADAKPDDSDTTGGWVVERQLWVVPALNAREIAATRDLANQEKRYWSFDDSPRQLTFGKEKVSDPQWSFSGKQIAFLRKHDGKMRIHVLTLDGGEARVIDTGELEPESIRWSTSGEFIAFTATPALNEEEKAAKWRSGGATSVGEEWRNTRIYTISVHGDVKPVTDGKENIVEFEWSPDGKRFAVITSASADPYEAISRHNVKIISSEDGQLITPLETVPTQCANVRWSDSGDYVAYISASRNTMSLMPQLMVFQVGKGRNTNIARGKELTLLSITWAGDSRYIYALTFDQTRTRLWRFSPDGQQIEDLGLTPRVVEEGLTSSRNIERLAFMSSSVTEPIDPTVLDLTNERDTLISDASGMRTVVEVNPQEAGWTDPTSEVVKWTNADNTMIEGVLLKPAKSGETPLPLMVFPHGGPDWVSTERFSGWSRYFVARGWAVFMPNYRGSIGYNLDFYRANQGRLGEVELADIESGVDMLVQRRIADENKLVYGGWSWGGFCTAYTIGKTQRYKAAVVGAGVVDTVAQYATSDINHGQISQWEFKGDPWRTPDNFAKANPIASLSKVKTPTLILHGESDERVGYVNGILLHRALLDMRVPTKFLSYPREPHGFTEPAHIAHMLQAWSDWYAEHTK